MHFMTQNEILKMPAFGISTFDVTFQSEKWETVTMQNMPHTMSLACSFTVQVNIAWLLPTIR